MRYRVQQTETGNYGSFFALLLPPTKNPKNKNFDKMKKIAGDISILTMCTKTTIIWGTVPEKMSGKQNFLLFWTIFCPFTPLTTQKIKILKKWKKAYYHFTLLHHKWRSYDVWFLRHGVRQTEFLSFWTIFCPFNPLTTQKT